MVLFRGVCCFSPHICYFSCVLFGDKKIFRIFAGDEGRRNNMFSRRKQSGTMKENKLSLKLNEKVKLLIWR